MESIMFLEAVNVKNRSKIKTSCSVHTFNKTADSQLHIDSYKRIVRANDWHYKKKSSIFRLSPGDKDFG